MGYIIKRQFQIYHSKKIYIYIYIYIYIIIYSFLPYELSDRYLRRVINSHMDYKKGNRKYISFTKHAANGRRMFTHICGCSPQVTNELILTYSVHYASQT